MNEINKERFQELHNKLIEKSYIQNRSDEIAKESKLLQSIEDYFKLGQSSAYGLMLYLLTNEDFSKSDIKKLIIKALKDDVQLRSDTYGVWSEYLENEK